MKAKTLAALAGIGSAMITTGSAHAAFIGIGVEHSNQFFSNHTNLAVRNAWNAGPNTQYDIFRIYANFDSNTEDDRVNAVAGTPQNPFSLTVLSGSIHNHVDNYGNHFNLPPGVNPPEAAWDTYVTINGLPSGGIATPTPGFGAEVGNLTGSFSTTNAAVFVTPDHTQGQARAAPPGQLQAPPGVYRVLLMQITISQGGLFEGTMSLNVDGQDLAQTFTNIPAPGAIALLGVAGLIGPRRRRAGAAE